MTKFIFMSDEDIHTKMREAFQAVTQDTVSGKRAYEWMNENGLEEIHLNIADLEDNDEMLAKFVCNPEEAIVSYVVSAFAFKKARMMLELDGGIPYDYADKLQDIVSPLVQDVLNELEDTGFSPVP